MEITDISTHLVRTSAQPVESNRLLLVQVRTDEGITGIGEAGVWGALEPTETAVQQFGRYLVGKNPLNREDHFQYLYRWSHFRGAPLMGALSAIDIALWDIAGRYYGEPIHELLGGPCREKARVYVHVRGETKEELVEECRMAKSQGFTAVGHLNPLLDEPADRPYFETHSGLLHDATERVEAFREAVGTDVDLCIEMHRRLDPHEAISLADEIRPQRPMFFEDPVPPQNFDEMAQVAENTRLPIATGERLHTIHEFEMLLQRDAVDYLRPNLGHTGGITQAKKIAALAEASYAEVVPHCPAGPVIQAASLQLDASIPNFGIQEFPYRPAFEATKGEDLLVDPLEISDGFVRVPDEPGLGIRLDESALADAEANYTPREITTRRHEDGSIVDQ